MKCRRSLTEAGGAVLSNSFHLKDHAESGIFPPFVGFTHGIYINNLVHQIPTQHMSVLPKRHQKQVISFEVTA